MFGTCPLMCDCAQMPRIGMSEKMNRLAGDGILHIVHIWHLCPWCNWNSLALDHISTMLMLCLMYVPNVIAFWSISDLFLQTSSTVRFDLLRGTNWSVYSSKAREVLSCFMQPHDYLKRTYRQINMPYYGQFTIIPKISLNRIQIQIQWALKCPATQNKKINAVECGRSCQGV